MSTRVREHNTNTTEINTLLTSPIHLEIVEALAREELSLEEGYPKYLFSTGSGQTKWSNQLVDQR